MYSVEINLREGTKTTKKPIGTICPIDDGYFEFNEFWRKWSKKKQEKHNKKLNEIGFRSQPRIRQKLPCGKCFSYNVTIRKVKNQERYQGKCNDCDSVWFQSHK